MLNQSYVMNNGIKIPKLGLGTWLMSEEQAENAVKNAVEVGYRLIDTAQAYGNEEGVGKGIRGCAVPREQLFVTSKVAAELKTYESAAASIDKTLSKAGLSYIDMMLIHSPQPWAEFRGEKRYFEENREVWRALEDACQSGKVKTIGVSNFLRDDLENILSVCRIKPAVNQILLHITKTDRELLEYCRAENILVEAYSPIAHGAALNEPLIAAMAKKYGVSPAALCVRYVLQLGTVALPKATSRAHIEDDAAVNFEISEEDMRVLMSPEDIDYGESGVFPVFGGKK